MTLARAVAGVRRLLGRRADGCASCRHFETDRARVETALPGLSALASTQSSVWASSGLCLRDDRVINGRRRCPAFETPARRI